MPFSYNYHNCCQQIMIVLEYATNGDLSKYLINMRPV